MSGAPLIPLVTPEVRQSTATGLADIWREHGDALAATETAMAALVRASAPAPGVDPAERLRIVHEAAGHIAAALKAEAVGWDSPTGPCSPACDPRTWPSLRIRRFTEVRVGRAAPSAGGSIPVPATADEARNR